MAGNDKNNLLNVNAVSLIIKRRLQCEFCM